MQPRIWYVNVFVSDLDRSIDFYENVLGMPLQFRDDEHGYASVEPEGIRLGLARVAPDSPETSPLVGRHTGVGLGVPDLEAAHEELVAKGVRFPMPPAKQAWGGFMATIEDPDGNVFYLDQLRDL